MKLLLLWLGSMVAAILPCGAAGRPMLLEQPPMSMDLIPDAPEVVGKPLYVGVLVSGSACNGAVAQVHISASAGLPIAAGETTFTVPMVGLVPMRHVQLNGQGPGQFVLRARMMQVHEGGECAVAEVALPVRVHGDTLVAGPRSYYRSEFVDLGQRYRAAGIYWVPIEAPEEVGPADVLAERVKPVVERQEPARCPDCGAAVTSVQMFAVVDRSGVVRYARAPGDRHIAAVEDRARAAVMKWRFAPGRIGHTPVTDWLIVDVPISR